MIFYAVLVVAALVALYFLRLQWEKENIDNLKTRAVFLTGCDTGFAHQAALNMAKRGMPVFAGCFTEEGMSNIEKAAAGFPGKLKAIPLNVASDESVDKAAKILEEETRPYGGLHAIVNNAGIGTNIFFDDFLTADDYRPTMEVNLFGMIRVSQKMRKLVKQTKGRIVNITSIAGRCPFGGLGPYTVSKHSQNAYSDLIRKELAPFGVSVITIEPGFFKTPITAKNRVAKDIQAVWDRAPEHVKLEYGADWIAKAIEYCSSFVDGTGATDITPVVDTYVKACISANPRRRYKIGWDCIFLWNTIALAPTNIQDGIFAFLDKVMGAPVPAILQKKIN